MEGVDLAWKRRVIHVKNPLMQRRESQKAWMEKGLNPKRKRFVEIMSLETMKRSGRNNGK